MKLRRPPSGHSCCCPICRANIRIYFFLFRCIERRLTKFVLCRHRTRGYAPHDRRICSRLKKNAITVTLNFLGCTYLWFGQCMWLIPVHVHRKENYCKESAVTDLSLFFLCRAKSSHTSLLDRTIYTAFSTNDPKPAKVRVYVTSRSTIDAKLTLRLGYYQNFIDNSTVHYLLCLSILNQPLI